MRPLFEIEKSYYYFATHNNASTKQGTSRFQEIVQAYIYFVLTLNTKNFYLKSNQVYSLDGSRDSGFSILVTCFS